MQTIILQSLFIAVVGAMLVLCHLAIDRSALRQKLERIYLPQSDTTSAQARKGMMQRRSVVTRWTWLMLFAILSSVIVLMKPEPPIPFYPYGRFTVASSHNYNNPAPTRSISKSSPHPQAYGRFGIVKPLFEGNTTKE